MEKEMNERRSYLTKRIFFTNIHTSPEIIDLFTFINSF